MLTMTMQIRPRFPGANWERAKFLDFLQDRARRGETQAAQLRADLFELSGQSVAGFDMELRSVSLDARQKAGRWATGSAALAAGGAVAGYLAAGWWGAAAGLALGLPLAVPAGLQVRQQRAAEEQDLLLRHYSAALARS